MDILRDEFVKARKPHTCDYCLLRIAKGQKYLKTVMADQGELIVFKAHEECQEIAGILHRYFDKNDDEGYDHNSFRQAVRDYYKEHAHDDMPQLMGALKSMIHAWIVSEPKSKRDYHYTLRWDGRYIQIWENEEHGVLMLKATPDCIEELKSKYDAEHDWIKGHMQEFLEDALGNGWEYGDAELFNLALCTHPHLIAWDVYQDDDGNYEIKKDDDMWAYDMCITHDPLVELMKGKCIYYDRI